VFGFKESKNSGLLTQPGRPKSEVEPPSVLPQAKLSEENAPLPPQPPKRPKRIKLQELIRKTGKMTMGLDRSMLQEVAEKSLGAEVSVQIDPKASAEELVSYALTLAKDHKVREATRVGEAAEAKGLSEETARDFWTEIGNACYDADLMSLAAQAFRKSYDKDPQSMTTLFNLGVALHCMNQLDEAQGFYEKGTTLDPEHPKLCCNLGVIHFQKDRYQESEMWMKRSVEAKPDYVRGWDNLASAYGAQNRFEEATEACEKAIELNPECLAAWFKVGLIRFASENYSAAKMAFLQAQPLEVCRAYIDYHLAMIACQEWNDEEAEKLCRDACLLDRKCPVGPAAWTELADFYKVQGKISKSKASYKVAADLEKLFVSPDKATEAQQPADFGVQS
jgi:tetratricopeptide (TPR) repeat protein